MSRTLLLATLVVLTGTPYVNAQAQQPRLRRESIEFCNFWIPSAHRTDVTRVLLVGDSITQRYYGQVAKRLGEKAVCSRFSTSAHVADPSFLLQLAPMFSGYQYDVIHFNNGLHGMAYKEDEYREGLEQAIAFIQENSPSAKVILALTTPLQSTSPRSGNLNPTVDRRNEVAREIAKKYGFPVNDLHSISVGHPEHYVDPYHFKPEAVLLQSEKVAAMIAQVLGGPASEAAGE